MTGAQMVFVDPDNGLEGKNPTDKHVLFDELAPLCDGNRTIVIYQHQGRMSGGRAVEIPWRLRQVRKTNLELIFSDHDKNMILEGFRNLYLGPSSSSSEPLVLGNIFIAVMSSFMTSFLSHVHDSPMGLTGFPDLVTIADITALRDDFVDNGIIVSDSVFTFPHT